MSRGEEVRLFVAVELPLEVREELAAWGRLVAASAPVGRPTGSRPAIRTLAAESLHLTLCFLGGRPPAEIGALSAVLDECSASVGELSVGAPLLLPPRRPRALAVEIHDTEGELARLQARLTTTIARVCSWEPTERRGSRAHVTVARMRTDARHLPAGQPLPATPRLHFTPERIGLYRSWLAPEGASYETLASCELESEAG
jgi:RNA 2',3'-cyclic 3'-phosphodiesterase